MTRGSQDAHVPAEARNFQGLPDYPALLFLKQKPQWVAWDYRGARRAKVPVNARSGANAKVSDPATWSDYEAAADRAIRAGLAGVGFVLKADDGIVGIDLDGCRDADTGTLDAWAADIVALQETYAEVSPSGRGLRLLALATSDVASFTASKVGVEVYARGGRYITITGDHLADAPVDINAAPRTIAMLRERVEALTEPSLDGESVSPARIRTGKETAFTRINDAALQKLSDWVPTLLPAAREHGKGYRVTSEDLGRPLEEDLSIMPNGIKDFGVHDMGDARGGRRTPINLVLEHAADAELDLQRGAFGAAMWLCEQLGIEPASLGFCSPASAFDDVVATPAEDEGGGASGGVQDSVALPLPTLSGSDFAARDLRARPWLVKDMIPDRTVTLLSGDGGTGKSLLAQQLAVAVAASCDWLGTVPAAGGAIYVSAEDDIDEVHRRLVDITKTNGLSLDDLADLHIVPMAGKDAVLVLPDRRSDAMKATPLWPSLIATVEAIRPRLLVLDNLADVFAGNENSRPQARQFIGMLRGVAIDYEVAVLVISHPSLTGLSSGTGTSGSTAWSNSVRSRLYLERPKADGEELDPDRRLLRVMKANYAAVGAETQLRWDNGTLRLDGAPGGLDRAAAGARAERVFLTLLARFATDGRNVSPKHSPSFAPTVFAKHPEAEGCTKHMLDRAMERLFSARKIKVEPFGPPSRLYSRIVLTST